MYFEYKELLKPPIARAAYSDRTAWLMAVMSNLAYIKFEQDDAELEKLKNELGDGDFKLLDTFNRGDSQAFLARRNNDKMLVLAFRGTEESNIKDIWTDLNVKYYQDKDGVKIHTGFRDAFQNIKDDINTHLSQYKDHALYITGHSLGGGMALIATREFNSDNLAACYTFGSPKVGNSEFGDSIKPPIYRVVHGYDGVPCLPPTYILDFLYYVFRYFKRKRLMEFVQKYRLYNHHGDMRYILPSEKNDVTRIISNKSEIVRTIELLLKTISDKSTGINFHSKEQYYKKLENYALKRVSEK